MWGQGEFLTRADTRESASSLHWQPLLPAHAGLVSISGHLVDLLRERLFSHHCLYSLFQFLT